MGKKKLKRSVKIAVGVLVLLGSLSMFLISFYGYQLSGVDKVDNKKTIDFTISEGESINNIVSDLKESNLIRSEFFTKIYIKLNRINNLQAGNYEVDSSLNTKEILELLITGKITNKDEISITFKEGKNIWNVASVISKNTNNKEEDVYELLKDESYIDSLISEYWFLSDDIKNKDLYFPLEGYLFPNTYRFKNKDVTVREIFKKMLDETNRILTKYKGDIEDKEMSIHEFLTLASIVELEGKFDDDRAMIAGVFYKRLKANWSLGSDVTTYYANKLDMGKNPELYQTHIDMISPYNTRLKSMNGKLPIGPIANSGEASIKAVINPVTTDNWYFVADCRTMKTVFTKTFTEHDTTAAAIKASGCKF